MSKEVQELFTAIAPKYDFLNHFLSFSIDKGWRDKAITALKQGPYPHLLDLCAGTLDLSKKLAKRFPESKIFSVDFSLAMLEKGRNKINAGQSVWRICADGHLLPFSNDFFDAISCAFGIRNLEHHDRAAQEIRRVLKPKGKLVVLEFFRPNQWFSRLFYQTYGKHILPHIGGTLAKNRQAYQYLQDSIQNFLSVEEYSQLLQRHGFHSIETRSLSGGIVHLVVAEG